MKYPIHERFLTFQGEGVHMGRKAFFIRTMGCPVKCPWCDSAGTWHPDWVPDEKLLMSPEELHLEVLKSRPEIVVVTGGEPTIFNLHDLVDEIHKSAIPVHLETSGSRQIQGRFDWVTVSPKRWACLLEQPARLAREFKIIVEGENPGACITFYLDMIDDACGGHTNTPIWLHPEWTQRNNPEVLKAICDAVSRGDNRFRAGYQLHKLYRVDALDPRMKTPVPLGGDPEKGF